MQGGVSEACAAVVLYGLDVSETGAARFYDAIIQWAQEIEHPPDKLGLAGRGQTGKYRSFSRADRDLRRLGFAGVTAVEMKSMIPGGRIDRGEYLWAAIYSTAPAYAVVASRTSVVTLDSLTASLGRRLVEWLPPAYGIGYSRDCVIGPTWYAVGVGYGEDPRGDQSYEEALRHARWGDIGMTSEVYRVGVLRDVYPWNLLTRPHLERRIGPITLEEWIRGGANCGRLTPLPSTAAVWELSEAEIPEVRQTLTGASILFRWQDYLGQTDR